MFKEYIKYDILSIQLQCLNIAIMRRIVAGPVAEDREILYGQDERKEGSANYPGVVQRLRHLRHILSKEGSGSR